MIDEIDTDLYHILDVSRHATKEEIKRAYRRRARECHPDVNVDDPECELEFKKLTFAYEVLSDDRKRGEYDRFGVDAFKKGGVGYEDFGDSGSFSDLIDMFFGEAFGGPFGRSRTRSRRGQDLSLALQLTLEEVVTGVEKELVVPVKVSCDECGGKGNMPGTFPSRCSYCDGVGQVRSSQRTLFGTFVRSQVCPRCQGGGEIIDNPCIRCKGEGRLQRDQTITVSVPPGAESEDRLGLRGKGDAGYLGAPSGDLYVVLIIKQHKYFYRGGKDLYCNVAVNMAEAALGTDIEIPRFEETLMIKVPPGTQPGDILKVKGKGVPPRGGGKCGDLLVEVLVVVPKKLRNEERKALRVFADAYKSKSDGSGIIERAKKGSL